MSTPNRLLCAARCRPWLTRVRGLLQVVAVSALGLASGLAVVSPVAIAAEPAAATKDAKPKSKKRAKKPKGTAATLSQLLVDKASQVQDCAVQSALNKGTDRVDIAIKVTINNRGQIISLNTNVRVDKGDGAPKLKDCIESLIRTISFPPSDAPMITIDRSWTITN